MAISDIAKVRVAVLSDKRIQAALRRASVIGAILSTLIMSTHPATAANPGVLLKQKSLMIGRSELLYSKDGIKLDLYEKNQVIIMRPPLWRVQNFHTANKLYWEGDATTFKFNLTATCSIFRPGDTSNLKPSTSEATTLSGLACRKYKLLGQKLDVTQMKRTWEGLVVRDGELWAVAMPGVPSNIYKLLATGFGAPGVSGIPMAMEVYNNTGRKSKELEVLSVIHKNTTADDFKIPSGYKKVLKPEEITVSPGASKDFAEWMQ